MKNLFPNLLSHEVKGGFKKPHYQRIWLFSVFTTVFVSISPLIVMAVMNYALYQRTLKDEIINPVRLMVASSKRSLEYSLEERKNALMFIANENTTRKLSDENALNKIKTNLETSFQHFIDLSLINGKGKLISYAGPVQIKEKLVNVDYSDDEWFQGVLMKSVHVSDVFTGYRGMPHFVISIRINSPDNQHYILRATLGMEILTSHVPTIRKDGMDDAFIINREGKPQTTVRGLAHPIKDMVGNFSSDSVHLEIYDFDNESGQSVVMSSAHIRDSPFILIMTRKLPGFGEGDMTVGMEMLYILLVSIGVILLLTMVIFSAFVNRIRRSDKVREEALHHIEYNAKMASIGRLAAGVAHEINNPLAIINEKAGLLQDYLNVDDNFPPKEKVNQVITSIQSAVERGAKITHRLLSFARQLDVKKEPIYLPGLIQEVTGFIEKDASINNIKMELSFSENFPEIESDRGQLQQVILNLLNNSIQAIRKNGHIIISGSLIGTSHVSISVKDDGGGISKEALTHIFEPFFTTKKDGTGLGLAITYGIVRKLKGTISVKSEMGLGTEFILILPVSAEYTLDGKELKSDGSGNNTGDASAQAEKDNAK